MVVVVTAHSSSRSSNSSSSSSSSSKSSSRSSSIRGSSIGSSSICSTSSSSSSILVITEAEAPDLIQLRYPAARCPSKGLQSKVILLFIQDGYLT